MASAVTTQTGPAGDALALREQTGDALSRPESYRVRLYFGPRLNLHHCAKLMVGLCGLQGRGVVELEAVPEDGVPGGSLVVHLDVAISGADRPRRLAIDLFDQHDRFCADSLAVCDVYLKRSYQAAAVAELPAAVRGKVAPFGLNVACSSWRSRQFVTRAMIRTLLARWAGHKTFQELRQGLQQLRRFLWKFPPHMMEQSADVPAEPIVLYQTRLWESEIVGTEVDVNAINAERIKMVLGLRRALGPRFRGGLVPSPTALSRYPDLVVTTGIKQRAYLRQNKRALIGIYTPGLHDSLGFKMAEYLASSKCVVSVPLASELPEPLLAGTHYRAFRDVDDCVGQCEELLARPQDAQAMRLANGEYYRRWVEPEAHLLWCLRQVVELGNREQRIVR